MLKELFPKYSEQIRVDQIIIIFLKKFKSYPANLRYKLIERKLACLYRLGNYDLVLETIAEEHALELEIFKDYMKNIDEMKKKKAGEPDKKIDEDVKKYLESHIDISYAIPEAEKNTKIECASKDICIEYGVEKGFYIKAESEIEAGELIVDEPPFASVLLGGSMEEFCYECQEKVDPLKHCIVYCRQCVNAMYCGRECEKKSWATSHKYECKHIKLLGD